MSKKILTSSRSRDIAVSLVIIVVSILLVYTLYAFEVHSMSKESITITREMSNKLLCDKIPIGVVNAIIWFVMHFFVFKKMGKN